MGSRLTQHGKRRIRERTDYNKRLITLVKIVSRNGLSKGMFRGKFHDYLERKAARGALIKVYQNNIYFLSKNSRRLITTYPIPEQFLPIEQYRIPEETVIIMNKIINRVNQHVVLSLKDGSSIKGLIPEYSISENLENMIFIYNDDIALVKIDDISDINPDVEYLNEEIKEFVS